MTSTILERVVEVQQWLPQATGEALPTSIMASGPQFVTVQFRPLSSSESVKVARAIAGNHPLDLTRAGQLTTNSNGCPLPTWLERHIATLPDTTFTVEIHWDVVRLHPRIFVLDPIINLSTDPKHRHLFLALHPIHFANAICVYAPHDSDWDPQDSQYPLLVRIAAWLACHQIWQATGQWIGLETTHNRHLILKKFGKRQCYCGSGLPMLSCCERQGVRPLSAMGNRKARRANRAGGSV